MKAKTNKSQEILTLKSRPSLEIKKHYSFEELKYLKHKMMNIIQARFHPIRMPRLYSGVQSLTS